MRFWPVLLLVVLAGAVELEGEEQEVAEVQEDTREREVRADNLPPPSRPQRRPGSGAGFSSFLSGNGYCKRYQHSCMESRNTQMLCHVLGIGHVPSACAQLCQLLLRATKDS